MPPQGNNAVRRSRGDLKTIPDLAKPEVTLPFLDVAGRIGARVPAIRLGLDRGRGGTGVGLAGGLALSRDLARARRGELSVESKVGVGPTFTLTLPRAGAASTDSTHGAGSELSTDVHVDSLVHREP